MKKYEWKMKSFAKGIDPDAAVIELERIENLFGSLTPENILKASEDTEALLHPLFEWDNTKAAEMYRMSQARSIINNVEIVVISDGQSRNISVYEIVSVGEHRAYKHIDTLTENEVEQVKRTTLRELNNLKSKLSIYKEFTTTVKHIDKAIESI